MGWLSFVLLCVRLFTGSAQQPTQRWTAAVLKIGCAEQSSAVVPAAAWAACASRDFKGASISSGSHVARCCSSGAVRGSCPQCTASPVGGFTTPGASAAAAIVLGQLSELVGVVSSCKCSSGGQQVSVAGVPAGAWAACTSGKHKCEAISSHVARCCSGGAVRGSSPQCTASPLGGFPTLRAPAAVAPPPPPSSPPPPSRNPRSAQWVPGGCITQAQQRMSAGKCSRSASWSMGRLHIKRCQR